MIMLPTSSWWRTTVGSVRCTNTSYGTVPSMGVMWSASLWKASQMPARRAAAPAALKRSAHSRQSSSERVVSGVKLGTIKYSWPSRWAIARLRSHPTSTTVGETCAEGARSPS